MRNVGKRSGGQRRDEGVIETLVRRIVRGLIGPGPATYLEGEPMWAHRISPISLV
jgi:hypothetical protein